MADIVSGQDVDIIGSLPAGTNNIGDVDVLSTVPATNRVVTGTFTGSGQTVEITSDGTGTIYFEIATGLVGATVLPQATIDDSTWFTVPYFTVAGVYTGPSPSLTSFPARGSIDGYSKVRLFIVGYGSGSSAVTLEASDSQRMFPPSVALSGGSATIGSISDITSSVTPGTGASALGKAEDAVHNSGDVGVMALGVRKDTAAATAADGDYQPFIFDSTGKLHVNVGNSVTVSATNLSTNIAQMNGVTTSMSTGATDTGTQRVIQANGAGKTILSVSGTAASSGNNTLLAAGTNKLKVFAFSLTTLSTTAVTCIFQSGASGTEIWSVVLQAPTGAFAGANLAVTPPAWLFATASATLLNLNLSVAQTVRYSLSYYDEA